jgi:cbb3-type cytochrome oxidase subunit 3
MTWPMFFERHFAQVWWLVFLSMFWLGIMWVMRGL